MRFAQKTPTGIFKVLLALVPLSITMWAAQRTPNIDPKNWTIQDAQRILTASPWVQQASASFGTEEIPPGVPAGPMPDPSKGGRDGATDGRWDGGIGRNDRGGVPSLTVTIRWDSALPVREALAKTNQGVYVAQQFQKDYVITVLGLVPGGSYRGAGKLETQSTSDENSMDKRDPEEMLEGLMAASRLVPRGKAAISPEDVKLDAATGAIHLFFPRTQPIGLKDKEVIFTTRFGSMKIDKRFRLKDMTYLGKLEL